jgi:hypothetical protein
MIEADIRRLDEREPVAVLKGLEADIWAGIAARAAARRTGRLVVFWQAAVMALAIVGSVATGLVLATSSELPRAGMFTPAGMNLAPSHLLLDEAR